MTFTELRQMVRREIIVDQYEDAYTNSDIEEVLWKASLDIASAFDIPRAIGSQEVPVNATSITLVAPIRRLHTLQIAGDDGVSVDLVTVWRMRGVSPGPLRYFNFDPRRSTNVEVAPASFGGTAFFEYTPPLQRPGNLLAAQPWNGVLSEFHNAIAYRAGVTLFEMAERQDEAQHWSEQYQLRSSELALFLGRTDMANLMIQPEARDDPGSQG